MALKIAASLNKVRGEKTPTRKALRRDLQKVGSDGEPS